MRNFFNVRKVKMPSQEKRTEIENQVSALMSKNPILGVPAFDISRYLTSNQGFSIAIRPIGDDTTGMLLVDDNNYIPDTNSHKLIVINSLLKDPNIQQDQQKAEEFIRRKRFIIAHEYGHYILHKDGETTQYAHRDTKTKNAPLEKEADFFARCLLMPKEQVRDVLEMDFVSSLPIDSKADLVARTFRVTKKKALQRICEDLGYGQQPQ